jgi:hypothetical protein
MWVVSGRCDARFSCASATSAMIRRCWSAFDMLRLRMCICGSVLVPSGEDCVRGNALNAEGPVGMGIPVSTSVCVSRWRSLGADKGECISGEDIEEAGGEIRAGG